MRIVILIVILFSVSAQATVQMPENLEVDAAYFQIYQEPLDSHPLYEEITKKLAESLCTANYRGYEGWWQLSDGYLWLSGISENPCDDVPNELEIEDIFNTDEYRIKAIWFTGEIIVRISERTFFEGSRRTEYQAVVYSFVKGKLSQREIRTVVGRSNF